MNRKRNKKRQQEVPSTRANTPLLIAYLIGRAGYESKSAFNGLKGRVIDLDMVVSGKCAPGLSTSAIQRHKNMTMRIQFYIRRRPSVSNTSKHLIIVKMHTIHRKHGERGGREEVEKTNQEIDKEINNDHRRKSFFQHQKRGQ